MEPEIHVTGIGAILIVIGCLLGAVVFIVREVVPFLYKKVDDFWEFSGLWYWLWSKWFKKELFENWSEEHWKIKFTLLNMWRTSDRLIYKIKGFTHLYILRDLKKYHGREI